MSILGGAEVAVFPTIGKGGAGIGGAIGSEYFHHVGIIRRVLLRMAAWMNYVFPIH